MTKRIMSKGEKMFGEIEITLQGVGRLHEIAMLQTANDAMNVENEKDYEYFSFGWD